MMSELAQFKQQKTVHILFSGLQGEQFNSLLGMQTYDARTDVDPHVLQALPSLDENVWHLIDFRPVRQLRLNNVDPKLKSMIFGFDFWVLVPETKGVTAF